MLVGTGEKPLERAIDEPRIELRQCLVAKTDFVHPTGTEVLDQHVSAGKQLFCECEPARVRKLKGNAALVAVEGDEKTSPRPRQPPCVVPWSGRLDFDDVCAKVGQYKPACRTHDHVREFHHSHPFERKRRYHGEALPRVSGSGYPRPIAILWNHALPDGSLRQACSARR
jgi:hypothetical protein